PRPLLMHSSRTIPPLHSFPTRRSSDLLLLNSQPSPGIFDSPGTPAWVTELFSLKMPPMTAVPPSATRIWVAARSVMIGGTSPTRSEEHTSELQSRSDLVCRLLLEKKKN